MRKQWFGDSRDYVKWSCILREAGSTHFVIYASMMRPDSLGGPNLDDEVRRFFDGQKDFAALGNLFLGGFAVIEEVYAASKSGLYVDLILREMTKRKNIPKLIFLDPDTGLAPKSGSGDEHIKIADLIRLFDNLEQNDKIVIYQHASRNANWREEQYGRLMSIFRKQECRVGKPYFEEKTAKDVCFFTLVKDMPSRS